MYNEAGVVKKKPPLVRCKKYSEVNQKENNGGRSSVGRAPDCDSGRRGFESHRPPQIFYQLDLMVLSGRPESIVDVIPVGHSL